MKDYLPVSHFMHDYPPTKAKLMLVALVGSEELAIKWWNSPNEGFNKLCPKDVPIEEVYSYLLGHLQR
jgi:hypothetical protein